MFQVAGVSGLTQSRRERRALVSLLCFERLLKSPALQQQLQTSATLRLCVRHYPFEVTETSRFYLRSSPKGPLGECFKLRSASPAQLRGSPCSVSGPARKAKTPKARTKMPQLPQQRGWRGSATPRLLIVSRCRARGSSAACAAERVEAASSAASFPAASFPAAWFQLPAPVRPDCRCPSR